MDICVELDEGKNYMQDARKEDESTSLLGHLQVREGVKIEGDREDKSTPPSLEIEDKMSYRREETRHENRQERIPAVPQQKEKEKRLNINEGGSFCKYQNVTKEKNEKFEDKRNVQKPHSLSHLQADENEEIQENSEFKITDSNIQRQRIAEEGQRFGVTHLYPMVLGVEESVNSSNKNKVQQQQEEQQEPDSSVDLEGCVEKIFSEKGTKLQIHTYSNSINNSEVPQSSSSYQHMEQVPLIIPPVIQCLDSSDEMDPQCLTRDSDSTLSPEIALCDTNISSHHMRMRFSPISSVTREEGKSDEGKGKETVRDRLGQKMLMFPQQIKRSETITLASDYMSKEESSLQATISPVTSQRNKMKVQSEEQKKKEEDEVEVRMGEHEEETNEEISEDEENEEQIQKQENEEISEDEKDEEEQIQEQENEEISEGEEDGDEQIQQQEQEKEEISEDVEDEEEQIQEQEQENEADSEEEEDPRERGIKPQYCHPSVKQVFYQCCSLYLVIVY